MESDDFPERIQYVYRDALDNIAFIKRHEWTVVGYGLATQFGIVTVSGQMTLSDDLRHLVVALIWMVPLYGAAVMLSFWRGMNKWRERLSYIYLNCFSNEERQSLGLGAKKPWTEHTFLFGLWAALVLSAILATAVMLHPTPVTSAPAAPMITPSQG